MLWACIQYECVLWANITLLFNVWACSLIASQWRPKHLQSIIPVTGLVFLLSSSSSVDDIIDQGLYHHRESENWSCDILDDRLHWPRNQERYEKNTKSAISLIFCFSTAIGNAVMGCGISCSALRFSHSDLILDSRRTGMTMKARLQYFMFYRHHPRATLSAKH